MVVRYLIVLILLVNLAVLGAFVWLGDEIRGVHDTAETMNGPTGFLTGKYATESSGLAIEVDIRYPLELNASADKLPVGLPIGFVYLGQNRCAYDMRVLDYLSPTLISETETSGSHSLIVGYGPEPSRLGQVLGAGSSSVDDCGQHGTLTLTPNNDANELQISSTGTVVIGPDLKASRGSLHDPPPSHFDVHDYLGKWTGTFEQFPSSDYKVELTMTPYPDSQSDAGSPLTIDDVMVDVAYPDLGCSGEIFLERIRSGAVEAIENLRPTGNCSGADLLILKVDADRLYLAGWEHGTAGQAVLSRTG